MMKKKQAVQQKIGKGAIIYVRVSSEEQVQGTSLSDQEARCRQYCKDNGFEVLKVFHEEGESAKSANRKELLAALEYCRKNRARVSAFVVWKIDRFARSSDDHYAVRKILKDYGVKLHSVSEPIADGHTGKLLEGVLAATAEFDNAIRTERSINGMEKRIKDGIWPHMPPVGYICAHHRRHGEKKTTPDRPDMRLFTLIQECLKGYAREVYTAADILKKLEKTEFEKLTGIKLRYQVVDRMLGRHLPFYAGLLYNAYAANRGEDCIYEPGKHKAMITVEEMEVIKATKSGKRPSRIGRDRYNPNFPLRRLVQCKGCGSYLTASTSKGRSERYSYYFCMNKECSERGVYIPKSDMEDDFSALMRRIKPSERFLAYFKEAAREYWRGKRDALTAHAREAQARLEELKEQRKNVCLMRERGEYDAALFRERMTEIDRDIALQSLALKEASLDDFDLESGVGYAEQFLCDVEGRWSGISPQFRPRFQKLVFPGGISYGKKDGFGTAEVGLIFKLNEAFDLKNSSIVPRRGLEPPTLAGQEPQSCAYTKFRHLGM